MTKRLTAIFIILVLSVFVCTSALASNTDLLVDDAELVKDHAKVEAALKSVSDKHNFDVVVVTVNSTGDKSDMEYADDFFDYGGYGRGENFDGVLLLVNMEECTTWVSTCGLGIEAFTDSDIESVLKQIAEPLGDGDYDGAFIEFAETADAYVDYVKNFDIVTSLLIAVVIGLIVAFAITLKMKLDLKSVFKQKKASNYERAGSLRLTNANQFFLYSHVDRRKKQQNTSSGGRSTHTSSSGRSHGGGGGRF